MANLDLLATAKWTCANVAPGAVTDPADLDVVPGWLPSTVPGTAVAALRDAGLWAWTDDDEELLDGRDWWWRADLPAPGPDLTGPDHNGPWALELEGLATIADVWVDGTHVLASDNMHVAHRVILDGPTRPERIALRCGALMPVLSQRRPRPRWRSKLVRHQNLRWIRTTPLGRIPGWSPSAAPVGPWRPVRLRSLAGGPHLLDADLHARVVPAGGPTSGGPTSGGPTGGGTTGGEVDVRLLLAGARPGPCTVSVGTVTGAAEVSPAGVDRWSVTAAVTVPDVARWWPHTHGDPTCYPVSLAVDGGDAISLGAVGFRTVEVDRSDDGFRVLLNGEPVFCRGACWVPPDATGLAAGPEAVRASLQLARDAGMNMIRVGGYTTYEDAVFWNACDELGLMVWQDCMLASVDPPEDEGYLAGLAHEVTQVLGSLRRHPALTVISGSSEIHQQAAMFGVDLDRITSTAVDVTIPAVATSLLPEIPYVPSSPTGGDVPFDPSKGVGHYFGVGAYQRPIEDARAAGVRFAAECLAFATPPEPATIERHFGSAAVGGHHPLWKRGVARDSDTSWDFEDVRDHYVRLLFGVDPYTVRYEDPERYLDLGRAAVAEVMARVLTDWRSAASACAGALVLDWQDVYPGAGWGLLDVDGHPKAPWYALRRVLAPVGVTVRDDGLSGLAMLVHNDRGEVLAATLVLQLFTMFGDRAERAELPVVLAGRSQATVGAAAMLNGFRDLTHAYRFGPPAYDAVQVRLEVGGATVSSAIYLPGGVGRAVEVDLGLEALVSGGPDGQWEMTVSTRRLAQWVSIEMPGFVAADSWFDLAPGEQRTVALTGGVGGRRPAGQVRALNLASPVAVKVE